MRACLNDYLNSTESLRLANELAGLAMRSKIAAKFGWQSKKSGGDSKRRAKSKITKNAKTSGRLTQVVAPAPLDHTPPQWPSPS